MGEQGIVIAIDGPSGSGKSTIARAVADRMAYLHIDSGAMYRAVAWWAARQGIDLSDEKRVSEGAGELQTFFKRTEAGLRVFIEEQDVTEAIRAPEVGQGASRVATYSEVRRALVAAQQRMGSRGGIVMEGRDIGTVVFPHAELKVFLDASPEERARRRYEQQQSAGMTASMAETVQEIRERDQRDQERRTSPLVQAADAVYLDSTALSIAEVTDVIVRLAEKRMAPTR